MRKTLLAVFGTVLLLFAGSTITLAQHHGGYGHDNRGGYVNVGHGGYWNAGLYWHQDRSYRPGLYIGGQW